MKTCLSFLIFSFLMLSGCSSDNRSLSFSRSDAQTLRVAVFELPDSYDPGQTRSIASTTTMRLIYEGLLRKSPDGRLVPGIAERWEVSDDGLTYRFFLRDAFWSNGFPITADDFIFAWKRQLNPLFPAPNAFQLFPIRGARAARLNGASLDTIALRSVSPKILEVELESPTATFLELTTFHSLFPLCASHCAEHVDWNTEGCDQLVANGPFLVKDRETFVKNPNYWDADTVQLDGVRFVNVDENTAVMLFENGELDWIGSPLDTLPTDTLEDLREKGILHIAPAAGTQFLRFNTNHKLLSDPRVRRALAFAINRDRICDHILLAGQTAATALVPPYISGCDRAARSLFIDASSVAARSQLNQTSAASSELILTYPTNNDRYHKLAQVLQQQWRETLGLQVKLERMESKLIYSRLKNGDYQIMIGSWFADIDDPINFLEVFERADNGTNNTGWERPRYQNLLANARCEQDSSRRTMLLKEAEALLIEEMPIAPINTFTFAFLCSDEVDGVIFSPLGYLDFKYAYKRSEP